ncbi:DUF4862 family protein [Mycetocola zhadangensis]|uniref:DUF4862 family protein n=1 Tax=Mycetocola zhadangensis TaxID=1164595 RepID=A0A3L7IUP1_9MICO|nr:DUF4862 family protein [Mycetocola zhadangensis]RLQ81071.1 DUF4862 family protein [Mycetocola zhadangensis]GGF04553.1 DUF4862 domain-containing protein [Mycetocola zhadangensis]
MTIAVQAGSVGREGILISSYAASPAHSSWDPELEGELLPALCSLPGVVGLEVPWLGRVHPHDDAWFLRNVPAGARLALTPLPYVMRRCAADPQYGIASRNAAGRASALEDMQRLAADVRMLTEQSGAEVALVALHTAPSAAADGAALQDSLHEIAGYDWSGAQLVIEHCDTIMPDRPFEKGFLPLADEIEAISATNTPIGMWLNWGRSIIELRDADAVTAQISAVADSGYLTGLTFSGAAASDGPYGAAWLDAHLPVLSADPESGSLLDDAHVGTAISAAGAVPWLGMKVSRRPSDRSAADVTRTVASNLGVLERMRAAGSRA